MAIKVGAGSLTIEDVVKVARHGEKIELAEEALSRIRKCRAMLEKKVTAHEIMYGVNTGIGEFSEVVLND
jgi:histidine ammonia-lyase